MTKNKILVFTRDPELYKEKLSKINLPNSELFFSNELGFEKHINDFNIFFGIPPFAKKYINQAKNLKWYQSSFAGIDSLITSELKTDYLLTNVKDTYGSIMAEYVLSYIFMFEKKIMEHKEWQNKKEWNQQGYRTLEYKKIGILGVGSIGSEIARKLKVFGCNVSGLRNSKKDHPEFDKIYQTGELLKFVSQVDYLVSVLPATSNTDDLISGEVFKVMPNHSVFMNIGRGNAVCEKSLTDALNQGEIKAAVIDVFKEEPLPKESPLWNIKNLYITPHVSGYYVGDEAFQIFEDNYNNFINNKPLKYLIDYNKGY